MRYRIPIAEYYSVATTTVVLAATAGVWTAVSDSETLRQGASAIDDDSLMSYHLALHIIPTAGATGIDFRLYDVTNAQAVWTYSTQGLQADGPLGTLPAGDAYLRWEYKATTQGLGLYGVSLVAVHRA